VIAHEEYDGMTQLYVHHRVTTEPLRWQQVGDDLRRAGAERIVTEGGTLYGIWRSQIGRPRDELTVMTVWHDEKRAASATPRLFEGTSSIRDWDCDYMVPTLRPTTAEPPRRQGSYAFRWFETPVQHWQEFLDLCAAAWPGFEAAYDSQIIGLWQSQASAEHMRRSLLLTRRPNLAMWERSKIPAGNEEAEVRRKLSRRYDLCDWTCVYTTTLLTAEDKADLVRWT
jgi:hypothetical protein